MPVSGSAIVNSALALPTPGPFEEEPMATQRRICRLKRRTVSAAAIITALAIAAPVAEASAATPGVPWPSLPLLPESAAAAALDWAAAPVPIVVPVGAGLAAARGPIVIGDVFNGGTTVVVSTSPAIGATVGSP
jgi:hypothetical protein